MPLVSIILTSYNHEEFIAQAIESVLEQTFTDYELIIVDDCSADNSWEVIKSFNDPRITAIRNEKNTGLPIYYNIFRCTGKYLAVHHSDDWWKPEKLAKQVDFLESNENYGAVFTLVDMMNEDGLAHESLKSGSVFDQPNRTRFEWLRFFLDNGNALCHPSVLIRKELYEEAMRPILAYKLLPDFCIWIRLCQKRDIFILQERLTCFRWFKHGKNMSGDKADNIIRGSTEMHFLTQEFLRIENQDDFLKVFPEGAEYLSNNEIVIPFVFARILLDRDISAPYKLAALRILYDVINNHELAAKVRKLHSYTHLDFTEETGAHDVFANIGDNFFLSSRLYFDSGNGFDDAEFIEAKSYINSNWEFALEIDVPGGNEYINTIGFVPEVKATVIRGYYSITRVLIDGAEAAALPIGSVKEDGVDVFYEATPMYLIEVGRKDVSRISILGKTNFRDIPSLHFELTELRKANRERQALLDKSNAVIQKLMG